MFDRRELLISAALTAAAATLPGWDLAVAQQIKSLRFFVPAAPGGGWDQTARTMEAVLRKANLIGSAQVTNVGGAGGTVGLPQFINQWKGQGDALMVAGLVMIGAIVGNKSPVNMSQVTPIARLTGEYEVVVVPQASPHKDLQSLIAAFKADPGKVSWAGGSAGGTDHILIGLIAQAVGVDPKKIAYVAYAGGGPAQAALLGNQVTAGVSGWGEFSEQVKAGKIRALGISAGSRVEGIDAPTLKEQGVDVELANWRGVFAPPQIAADKKKALLDLVEAMHKTPAWQEELKKREWTDLYLAGDAFGTLLQEEVKRVEGIMKQLGLA